MREFLVFVIVAVTAALPEPSITSLSRAAVLKSRHPIRHPGITSDTRYTIDTPLHMLGHPEPRQQACVDPLRLPGHVCGPASSTVTGALNTRELGGAGALMRLRGGLEADTVHQVTVWSVLFMACLHLFAANRMVNWYCPIKEHQMGPLGPERLRRYKVGRMVVSTFLQVH